VADLRGLLARDVPSAFGFAMLSVLIGHFSWEIVAFATVPLLGREADIEQDAGVPADGWAGHLEMSSNAEAKKVRTVSYCSGRTV
jgi:hypothetical protein